MRPPTPAGNPPDPAHSSSPAPSPQLQHGTAPRPSRGPIGRARRVLLAALPLLAIVVFAWAMAHQRASEAKSKALGPWMIAGVRAQLTRGLDPKFADADRDLVADRPSDPSRLVDPEPLAFSYIATDDPKEAAVTWRPLMDHIAAATGKKVVYFADARDAGGQIQALGDGRLHITGFNTGNVPTAVDRAGFVPCCVMAAPDGSYAYTMEIIVPADSPIESPSDLRGHTMTFTDLGSNSGFRAPLVLLRNAFKLEAGVDYDVNVSFGHANSIEGIAAKRFEAAAVADEVLKRILARGRIKGSQLRSIYRSEGFPPACIGTVYNLEPGLASRIRAALLDFDWKGTPLEKAYGPAGKAKFVPINYKDQWRFVRAIDAEILRMPGL